MLERHIPAKIVMRCVFLVALFAVPSLSFLGCSLNCRPSPAAFRGPFSRPDGASGQFSTPVDASNEPGDLANLECDDRVRVRFKNTPESDADVVILSPANYNLLRLATEHDIKINSACKTGLCGACTASMADPNWVDGEADGVQTIRTCSANVAVPFGME